MPQPSTTWPEGPDSPGLEADEVHVWQAALDGGADARDRLAPHLSARELERESRFRFARDATRYAIARGTLRVLLSRYCGAPPARLQLAESEYGRPSLERTETPDGFDFNLSHSRNLALFAFTVSGRVGIDIEWITPLTDMKDLVTQNFSRTEQQRWHGLRPGARERGFFACWTRKEAFVKAIGEGLSHPLDSFDVTLDPDQPPRLLRMGVAPEEQQRWSLHAMEPAPGYASALAIEAPTIALRRFSFTQR